MATANYREHPSPQQGETKGQASSLSTVESGIVHIGGSMASGVMVGGAFGGVPGAVIGGVLGLAVGTAMTIHENKQEK